MRNIMKAVMLRLKEQVPELGYVDINLGQMEADGAQTPCPCALVDVASVDYVPAAKGLNRPAIGVEVELFFRIAPLAAGGQGPEASEEALDMFDLVSRVDAALQGFEAADGFRPLCHQAMARNKPHAPRSFVLSYTCQATTGAF